MGPSRSRSLLAGALAVLLLAGAGGSTTAESAFFPSAVKITPNHDNKTIEVTAKIAFYQRGCSAGTSCDVSAADVTRIVKAIKDMWNNGSKYKCYTMVVNVEARAVGSQSEAGQTEIDIGLDYGPVPVRAFVRGGLNGADHPDHLSNSEEHRVVPGHDPDHPSTWPGRTGERTYAHEFGHILGLNDNYDPNRPGFPLPGASDDLMFRNQGEVTDEMVTRVVERSGQIKANELKCGLKSESNVAPIKWVGTRCDDADTEWLIQGETKSQGVTETFLYRAVVDPITMRGTYKYEAIGSIESAGSTFTKNAKGEASIVKLAGGSVMLLIAAATVDAVLYSPDGNITMKQPLMAVDFTWKAVADPNCS